jgi:TRAP-type mannitol/chloroaromatic compound transport system permease small subunit
MPSLPFVLPHWLYWGTLAIFPFVAIFFVNRQRKLGAPKGASLFIAYMFWLCSGFMGLHRFYLRNNWGFVFVPVFLLILHTTNDIRDRREDVSRTRAAVEATHSAVDHANIPAGVTATPEMTNSLTKAQAAAASAKSDFDAAQDDLARWQGYSRWLAMLMAAMLIGDALLLPWLVRAANVREAAERANAPPETVPPDVPAIGTSEDPTLGMHTRFTDVIETLNIRVGEFVAYWAVISVFGYYYEVIARFAFNSPTNWLHESMFLMYGMQYMLAGAYAYQSDQHVRVDVFYTKFSPRGKAYADIFTSIFFFIFAGTLFWTSGRFALDSFNPGGVGEVSFTEWGVQYWPVKLMMPIGAALLLLQGFAKLVKDIVLVTRGKA